MGRSRGQIRSAVRNCLLHVCNSKPRHSSKEIQMSSEAVFDSQLSDVSGVRSLLASQLLFSQYTLLILINVN